MSNIEPSEWTMSISGKRYIKDAEEPYSGFAFPCNDKKCIVSAACNLYCYHVFNYMNFIADNIYTMTADQIKMYRESTPLGLRIKIQQFYMEEKRLANPETATVSRDWK